MARPGPKPTPTSVKIARGNPGKRKLPDSEAQFTEDAPPEPDFLDENGLACYRDMVACCLKVKGLIQEPDYKQIAIYAEAWQDFRDAMQDIQDRGSTLISEKGNPYLNPSCGRKNKAVERMLKVAAKFGWTPADRVGLNLPHDKDEAKDAFADYSKRTA